VDLLYRPTELHALQHTVRVHAHKTLSMAVHVFQVPVPRLSWGTLNNSCGWKEFCDGAASTDVLQQLRDPTTERLRFDIVFTVDWHAALAWQRICEALQHDCSNCRPRWVFLSYRMFSRDEASSEVHSTRQSLALSLLNTARFPNFLLYFFHTVDHKLCKSLAWCLNAGLRAERNNHR
jgi:hypothetical protein